MSKSDTFENDLLKLIFNGTPITGIADNAASSPLTSLYVSLHTADPGEAGDQSTSEISYIGYARVPISRSAGGWTVTGSTVNPAAAIEFGQMTSGTGGSATYAAIGTDSTGTGKILYSGALTPAISVTNGVTPRVKSISTITEN